MILKYASFLIGIIWSYSIIKTQSVFSKKAGLIFKVFISKVSWLTLIAACYFGYKNFSIQYTIIGIIVGIIIVHLGFYFLKKFLTSKFSEENLQLTKSFFEYTLIAWVIYYVFFFFTLSSILHISNARSIIFFLDLRQYNIFLQEYLLLL